MTKPWIEGDAYVNDTIRLHGIIHRENPATTVVMHTHPPAVVIFSAFRRVPEVFDQESCLLMDEVAVIDENYEGRMLLLEGMVQRNLSVAQAARSNGLPPIPIAPLWQDFIERLQKSDPDLFVGTA